MRHHLFVCALLMLGQAVPPKTAEPASPSAPASLKSTPASEALVSAAKDYVSEKKSFDTSLQQARSSLEQSQQSLQKEIQDIQKQLNDQLVGDKKYKPMLDKIKELQVRSNSLQAEAQQRFSQEAGPVQAKMNSDKALVDGLIPIVKKENGFPDTAAFDIETQTWRTGGASNK